MGQRTDDLLFAIYEQLVELNSKAEAQQGELGLIRSKLQILEHRSQPEPGVGEEIAVGLGSQVQFERSSSTGDPWLSESISQYLDQKAHEVSPQHLAVMRLTLNTFEGTWGCRTLKAREVTRDMVIQYRTALVDSGRSVKTANNHLAIVGAFFAWCVELRFILTNPATGLKLKVRGRASRQRKAFTPEQIKHVFDGMRRGMVNGDSYARYWLPIIMLYTGARPEEVAQLRVGDVQQVARVHDEGGTDRTWVFDFATVDDGQRRKNEASRRLVPVHPRLWELGLDRLLRVPAIGRSDNLPGGARERGELLFPELTPGANGRLAEAPSRWFNRKWLRDVKGISDRKLVLYSLRHTVATELKHKGIEDSLIAQLLGHADGSVTTGRYGKEYPIEKLAEVVSQLSWGV